MQIISDLVYYNNEGEYEEVKESQARNSTSTMKFPDGISRTRELIKS